MTARELFILFGIESKKEDFDKVNENINKIKETVHTALEVYVGDKVIHGLIDTMKEFGETSREIMDAQLLGLNTTQYQILQQTAQMYGVQRQRFNMGIALMQRNAYEAIHGNKAAAITFAELGVKVDDNNGRLKNAGTLIAQIADGMKKFKGDPSTRVALGEKLFGMRDIEFQNMLLHGSEGLQKMAQDAESLGFVMNEKTVKAGEEFNRQMIRLQFIADGFKNKLMEGLAPEINKMVDGLMQWVKANKDLINTRIKEFSQGLVDVTTTLYEIIMNLLDAFRDLSQAVGGTSNAVKILIYTFLAFQAAAFIGKIGALVKMFWGLAAAIAASSAAMGALVGLLQLSGILALVTILYYMIKDIVGFFQGKKSITGEVVHAIKYLASNAAPGFEKGGHLTPASQKIWDSLPQNDRGKYAMHYHQENHIVVHEAKDAQQTGTAVQGALKRHTDAMIKDADRKLHYRTSS